MDKRFYMDVIEACGLKPDLEILPGGDQTEIGEKVSIWLSNYLFILINFIMIRALPGQGKTRKVGKFQN